MKRNILVTGAHRSGTTWMGKIISSAKKVRYVQEPFNVAIKNYKSPFLTNYEYLSDERTEADLQQAHAYINSFIATNTLAPLKKIFTANTMQGAWYSLGDFFNRRTHRTLFKDPLALLSAEWMSKEFNCDVLVLVRHPAAFVASLKVKNWEVNFNSIKRQPLLIKNHLQAYEEEIHDFAVSKKDIIAQGILIWNMLYHVVSTFQTNYAKEWLFIRHEDVSRDPIGAFKEIFEFLSLDFSQEVQDLIIVTTTSSNATKKLRNSEENIHTWKSRLSDEEIKQIKEGTQAVWPKFYSEDDW